MQINVHYTISTGAPPGPRNFWVQTIFGSSAPAQFTVEPVLNVAITFASIPDDRITVFLSPPGVSGTLTVQLVGGITHTVYSGTRSGGTHDVSFDIPNLPNNQEFTQLRATWTVGSQNPSATPSYHIKVLGDYHNTRYNTPTESFCTGSPVDMSYVSGTCSAAENCNFTAFQGKSEWWSKVDLNGSGLSQTPGIGVVSLEWYCTGPARKVRRVPSPCPQCSGMQIEVGGTVARNASNQDLPCGATLYVHQVGTVTVADAGGGLASNQLDHYAGFGGCDHAGGTIGNRKVIRLF